jgi:hypothetical protein
VLFSTFGAHSADFAFTPGTSAITVTTAGTYLVWFSVSGVEPNQFALMQNGATVPGGVFGSGAGTQQNSGMAVISASAGDSLTLRNHSSAAAVTLQTLAGGTETNSNASIIAQKIS